MLEQLQYDQIPFLSIDQRPPFLLPSVSILGDHLLQRRRLPWDHPSFRPYHFASCTAVTVQGEFAATSGLSISIVLGKDPSLPPFLAAPVGTCLQSFAPFEPGYSSPHLACRQRLLPQPWEMNHLHHHCCC